MAGCCDPRGCDRVFDERFARRRARRYRRRGLDRTEHRLVAAVDGPDLAGASVLEIGGGVGEVGLELLRRGAASVTVLELSPAYDRLAAELAAEAGFTGRVHRRLADIAAEPAAVEPADVVVLNRVVCCYPDVDGLLAAAAEHTRRRLAFSFPPRNLVSRSAVGVENRVLAWSGRGFRAFAHPPERMLGVLAEHGLRPAMVHRGPVWQVAAAPR